MSPFTKPPAPETTATQALRDRVLSRLRRGHLGRTSTDLSIPLPLLEKFAKGGELSAEQKALLTGEFFPYNTRFDPELDRFIDTSPPATSLGVVTPPFNPEGNTHYVPRDPDRGYGLASDGNVDPNAGKPRARPGFATS